MSSNNQLIIGKKKNKFYIHENLCVDNEFKATKNNLLEKSDTLKEAIKYAQKYCQEYPYVEYGYQISEECLK